MQNVEGYAGSAGTEPHAWETGLMDTITYVGLDVHKATISVALAESGRGGEIRQIGVFENRPEVLAKLAARLAKGDRRLSSCYEAGPCGYGLHRRLTVIAAHDPLVHTIAIRLRPIGSSPYRIDYAVDRPPIAAERALSERTDFPDLPLPSDIR
jgi:hypothetical protein